MNIIWLRLPDVDTNGEAKRSGPVQQQPEHSISSGGVGTRQLKQEVSGILQPILRTRLARQHFHSQLQLRLEHGCLVLIGLLRLSCLIRLLGELRAARGGCQRWVS